MSPAFQSPPPGTSTATALTTLSSGHPADGPGVAPGTRNAAGDSYVVFGDATIGGSINHVTNLGGDGSQTLNGTAAADDMVGGRDNDACSAAASMC